MEIALIQFNKKDKASYGSLSFADINILNDNKSNTEHFSKTRKKPKCIQICLEKKITFSKEKIGKHNYKKYAI